MGLIEPVLLQICDIDQSTALLKFFLLLFLFKNNTMNKIEENSLEAKTGYLGIKKNILYKK